MEAVEGFLVEVGAATRPLLKVAGVRAVEWRRANFGAPKGATGDIEQGSVRVYAGLRQRATGASAFGIQGFGRVRGLDCHEVRPA